MREKMEYCKTLLCEGVYIHGKLLIMTKTTVETATIVAGPSRARRIKS